MHSYNGDSILRAENPPELPRDETEVDPLVDPMTNPVVDPVSDPLNPMVGMDDKIDPGTTGNVDAELTDGANPYSDVAPALDGTNGPTETADFNGTPL